MATTNVSTLFKGARLVDFTGRVGGFEKWDGFSTKFTEMVRSDAQPKAVVIIDRIFAGRTASAMLVRDHVNMTGDNPLVGPNHTGGDRFPVVQGIYLTDCPAGVATGIAGGLCQGVLPDSDDITLMRSFGVDFCCYNVVPAMLAAAQAGWKVLAIGLPDGVELSAEQLKEIQELTRKN